MTNLTQDWPRPLHGANGPMRADKLAGAAEGMGEFGPQSQALAAQGLVPPDMMTGLTLFLLTQQPRDATQPQKIPGGAGGVAGGVWVRERFTIHRPLAAREVFHVQGQALGRHVHKGRRYGTNNCETRNASGELVGSNLTTGLLAYKVQPGLRDSVEGMAPDACPAPQPDWQAAAANPCAEALRELVVGQELGGQGLCLRLAMMEARDTAKPDNPIHSDPELARRAGLTKPIAGGSHVLAFALEQVMQVVGARALLYGACFDIRWKAPVYADLMIYPNARVTAVQSDRVVLALTVHLDNDVLAMAGELTVPLA